MRIMFKIGEFSQFSRVSAKMLRHYDELGLLRPSHVDPFTRYRYYSADQLPRLNRILALRDLGFSLDQIRVMLDEELPLAEIRGMLKLRRAEIQQQLREEESRLAQVESRLAQLEQSEQFPAYDVVVRRIEPELTAAIRQVVASDSQAVTRLFEELEAYVGRHQARAPRPPLLVYHDVEYQESGQDVAVMVPLSARVPVSGRISVQELVGCETMACVVHTGRYVTLPNALSALLGWIENNGYGIDGPIRETYLRFGADQQGYELPPAYLAHSAAEFVTELQIPVTKSK